MVVCGVTLGVTCHNMLQVVNHAVRMINPSAVKTIQALNTLPPVPQTLNTLPPVSPVKLTNKPAKQTVKQVCVLMEVYT